jgi:hypothetical protein
MSHKQAHSDRMWLTILIVHEEREANDCFGPWKRGAQWLLLTMPAVVDCMTKK